MVRITKAITYVVYLFLLGGLMGCFAEEYSYTKEKFTALPYDKKASVVGEVAVQVFPTIHKWHLGAPSDMGPPYVIAISIYSDFKYVSSGLKLDALQVRNVSKGNILNITLNGSNIFRKSGDNFAVEPRITFDNRFENGDAVSVIISVDIRDVNYQIERNFEFKRMTGTSTISIVDRLSQ